jgi:hypothetical protein
MTNNLSNTSSALVQELTPLAFQKILDDLAASDRSDHRVIVALLTIERECAAADLDAAAELEAAATFPIPPPAITTAGYADEGFAHSAYFDATPATPVPTPQNHAVAASRLGKTFINGMRKAGRRKSVTPKPVMPRRAVGKPLRAARARAPHSRASHGGARKGGDDGRGDHAPPSTPPPKPRSGYRVVNANCECWRRQFSNLFCAKCTPVDLLEVPKTAGGNA